MALDRQTENMCAKNTWDPLEEPDQEKLYRQLARNREVKFFADGESVTQGTFLKLIANSFYMADYVVRKEDGSLEIRIDRIDQF